MTAKKNWVYSTAAVRGRVDGGLSLVAVQGVVIAPVARELLADNARWLAATGCGGQVADYRDAVMAISADDLLRSAITAPPAIDTPTALLVHADQWPLWDRYCGLMARAGVLRAPFVDPAQAVEWARRQSTALALLPRQRGESRPAAPHTAGA